MSTLVKINCEWDIGQDSILFTSIANAKEWVQQALVDCGIDYSVDELKEDGLLCFEDVEVIS